MRSINPRKPWEIKDSIRLEIQEARRQTDLLLDMIHPSALHERPIAERHRFIFYLGHLEAFDWNLVCGAAFGMKPLDASLQRLFAFGIDPVDGNLPSDTVSDWPSIETVRRFNLQARQAVDACLDTANFSTREHPYVENGLIFSVAIEHRLMHLETLSYMLHWLPFDMKRTFIPSVPDSRPAPATRLVRIPAGKAALGLRRNTGGFGWDNEFEAHTVDVPEFEIDAYKVSNAEYLKFVQAGGYQERSFWTDASWNWIRSEDIRHPKFWLRKNNDWWYRTMSAEIPLPLAWPVYASHAEADAYARFAGRLLPTEAEFDRAAFTGTHAPRGNFGLQRWDPTPVDFYEDSHSRAVEMVGNGWEWTSSVFQPFPGFERFPFYPGYSADFFDGKHFVIKGASARTAARLARRSFRNWFQPHYPHIYAGFRCVRHLPGEVPVTLRKSL
jgi:gamma-glutamyl hercynylcysteine S-oxide synthase